MTKPLQQDINLWLEHVHHHLDQLADALEVQHHSNRRLVRARESLEETIAELYSEGSVQGKNKEERDACLHRLTAAERYELREAQEEHATASARVERQRLLVARDRQTRYALQMSLMLRTSEHPLEAAFDRLTKAIPFESGLLELERAG